MPREYKYWLSYFSGTEMETKSLIEGLLCLVAVQCVVVLANRYTSRYDNIDLDAFLSNQRALNSIIKCLLDKGPCTPEGKEIKGHLPEALSTNCAKCTDAQKSIIKRSSRYLMTNRASDWTEIANKYDPQRKYSDSFLKFIEES